MKPNKAQFRFVVTDGETVIGPAFVTRKAAQRFADSATLDGKPVLDSCRGFRIERREWIFRYV